MDQIPISDFCHPFLTQDCVDEQVPHRLLLSLCFLPFSLFSLYLSSFLLFFLSRFFSLLTYRYNCRHSPPGHVFLSRPMLQKTVFTLLSCWNISWSFFSPNTYSSEDIHMYVLCPPLIFHPTA